MFINEEFRHSIDVALDEAVLLGVEFSKEEDSVGCTFAVVAMDKNGDVPEDNRLLFDFHPVGRFVASLRKGRWDDKKAEVVRFEPENILEIVQDFGGQSIYGCNFINREEKYFNAWKNRLSFDYLSSQSRGLSNTIDLFQDGGGCKYLDLRIWFDDFDIMTPQYERVEIVDFLENGKRGWDAISACNEKMGKYGIVPMTKEGRQKYDEWFEANFPQKNWWARLKDKLKK